ncbi:Rha family transcriptional regulator [Weissella tructae]|uniref:Rha family transcriptional regulator n=1 Tax=Weissella tructae TaxID=887702 RepID=UPI001BDD1E74|nr:Rha family transcriptional regulator [Weissella tructae]QVV90857.1 Rha family transcriptional regulator [Weissella tructae]
MQEIVQIENNEVMTTSRQIAEVFGKEHKNVVRDIRAKIEKINELEDGSNLSSPTFIETSYINSQNKEHTMYKLNKDAVVLVVMNYQTKEALKFQLKYIDQFNLMEEQMKQQAQLFFDPQTLEQQIKLEELAISRMRAETAKSGEARRWIKMSDDKERITKAVAPKVISKLLNVSEQLLLDVEV